MTHQRSSICGRLLSISRFRCVLTSISAGVSVRPSIFNSFAFEFEDGFMMTGGSWSGRPSIQVPTYLHIRVYPRWDENTFKGCVRALLSTPTPTTVFSYTYNMIVCLLNVQCLHVEKFFVLHHNKMEGGLYFSLSHTFI